MYSSRLLLWRARCLWGEKGVVPTRRAVQAYCGICKLMPLMLTLGIMQCIHSILYCLQPGIPYVYSMLMLNMRRGLPTNDLPGAVPHPF